MDVDLKYRLHHPVLPEAHSIRLAVSPPYSKQPDVGKIWLRGVRYPNDWLVLDGDLVIIASLYIDTFSYHTSR